MFNIELAVLQTLDQEKWSSLSEISELTNIQERAAAEVLHDLDQNGIVESRKKSTQSGVEWRSMDNSLNIYLEGKVPC